MKKLRRVFKIVAPVLVCLLLTQHEATLSGAYGGRGQNHNISVEFSRTFPATGKTLEGAFLSYWNGNGGLAQLGYPVSDEMQERSEIDGKVYMIQYLERSVLEYHPENKVPYDVLLTLLGTIKLKERYPTGIPKGLEQPDPGAVIFKQTGKSLGGRFKEYWDSHGGLAQQGYPISEPFLERSELDGKEYRVQYFERAIFEEHAENKPPYDMLLSLLGTLRYVKTYQGTNPTPTPIAHTGGGPCTKRIRVTFLVYQFMPVIPNGNGCWSYERPVQTDWFIVHTHNLPNGKHVEGNPASAKWLYDDTSIEHGRNLDLARILEGSEGRNYGYVLLARRNGMWSKEGMNPGNVVDTFFAELYSGESEVDDLFDIWRNDPTIGRPMINIGRATNSEAKTATARLCRAVAEGSYIGFYSSQDVSPQNGKMAAVVDALNSCTTEGTVTPTPTRGITRTPTPSPTKVTPTVTPGQPLVLVPKVKGKPIEEARLALQGAGFFVVEHAIDSNCINVTCEVVDSSSPPEDTLAPRGSTVHITYYTQLIPLNSYWKIDKDS